MIYLSIILPAYNVEKYIIRCLDSIYKQHADLSMFETIVIDDGSPDNCAQIASSYLEPYGNGIVFKQENKGLGGARNTGLRIAKGKYVWFVDTDDEIFPDSLKAILDMLEKSNVDVFSYSYEKDVNGKRELVQLLDKPFIGTGPDLVKRIMIGPVWTNIYSRSFLLENSFSFKEHFYHEDGEFNMRAMTFSYQVHYMPFPIYRYYSKNPGSIMNNISIGHIVDYLKYMDTYEELLHTKVQNNKQLKCLDRYMRFMLSCLAHEALYLKDESYAEYRKMIKTRANRLRKCLRNSGLKKNIYYNIILMAPPKKIIKKLY